MIGFLERRLAFKQTANTTWIDPINTFEGVIFSGVHVAVTWSKIFFLLWHFNRSCEQSVKAVCD